MARPERNTVDYYPFFVGEGKKMFFIEKKYGNDGYATWLKIIDKLCITEYHFLNLNDEGELMFLAAKCNVDEDRLVSIINDIVKLGKFDRDMWLNKIIWCQSFVDSIQDAYGRRNNKCMTLDRLRKHLPSIGIAFNQLQSEKHDNKPQSKVKKKRVEETKEDVSAETYGSDGVYPKCMELYNQFIIARTGVGAKIDAATGSAMKKIITYLTSQIKDKDKISTEVPRAFEYVFIHFDRWDTFHKGQLNLNQIESNLVNIINAIRNGKPTTAIKPQSKYAPQR